MGGFVLNAPLLPARLVLEVRVVLVLVDVRDLLPLVLLLARVLPPLAAVCPAFVLTGLLDALALLLGRAGACFEPAVLLGLAPGVFAVTAPLLGRAGALLEVAVLFGFAPGVFAVTAPLLGLVVVGGVGKGLLGGVEPALLFGGVGKGLFGGPEFVLGGVGRGLFGGLELLLFVGGVGKGLFGALESVPGV